MREAARLLGIDMSSLICSSVDVVNKHDTLRKESYQNNKLMSRDERKGKVSFSEEKGMSTLNVKSTKSIGTIYSQKLQDVNCNQIKTTKFGVENSDGDILSKDLYLSDSDTGESQSEIGEVIRENFKEVNDTLEVEEPSTDEESVRDLMHHTKKVENGVVFARDVFDDRKFGNMSGKYVDCLFCSRKLTRSYHVRHCRRFHSGDFEDVNVKCKLCYLKMHALNLNYHIAVAHSTTRDNSGECEDINVASEKRLNMLAKDPSIQSGAKHSVKLESLKFKRSRRYINCKYCTECVSESSYARHCKHHHGNIGEFRYVRKHAPEGQKDSRIRYPRQTCFDIDVVNESKVRRKKNRVARTGSGKPHDLTSVDIASALSAIESNVSKKKKVAVNLAGTMKIIGSSAPVENVNGIAAINEIPIVDIPVDPKEPIYCLCQRASFGEMIQCDNLYCQEWFHFQCMALTENPKGKWYCPKCLPTFRKERK